VGQDAPKVHRRPAAIHVNDILDIGLLQSFLPIKASNSFMGERPVQVNRRRRNHGGTIIELERVAHQGIVMAGLVRLVPAIPMLRHRALHWARRDKPGDDILGWFDIESRRTEAISRRVL
jgi:hypothetical protein